MSQIIGVFMVIFGAAAIYVGCWKHYAELTALSGGITGAGLNMLTNNPQNTLNNRAGGIVAVNAEGEKPS